MHTVLIVEDELSIVGLYRLFFQLEGFNAIDAGTAADARSICQTNCPDVIVVDAGLPDSDGLTLLHQLQPLGIPAILISGDMHPALVKAAKAVGATPVEKIDGPEKLVTVAKNLLGAVIK